MKKTIGISLILVSFFTLNARVDNWESSTWSGKQIHDKVKVLSFKKMKVSTYPDGTWRIDYEAKVDRADMSCFQLRLNAYDKLGGHLFSILAPPRCPSTKRGWYKQSETGTSKDVEKHLINISVFTRDFIYARGHWTGPEPDHIHTVTFPHGGNSKNISK